jgi:hypothetical protein
LALKDVGLSESTFEIIPGRFSALPDTRSRIKNVDHLVFPWLFDAKFENDANILSRSHMTATKLGEVTEVFYKNSPETFIFFWFREIYYIDLK